MDNNYVIGRGELYFDKFADGTKTSEGGERYLGNSPEITVAGNQTLLDHYDADHGLKEKDLSILLQNDYSLQFTTDNVSPENLALWYLGDASRVTQTAVAAPGLTETVTLFPGRYFKLGKTKQTPQGVHHVTTIVINTTATTPVPVPAADNWEADLNAGTIYVEEDSTLITSDGVEVTITYGLEAGVESAVISKNKAIYGSLRYKSFNPVGQKVDHFYPYVMLQPNGNYALKGDEWQALGFTAQALKRDADTEVVYLTNASVAVTP